MIVMINNNSYTYVVRNSKREIFQRTKSRKKIRKIKIKHCCKLNIAVNKTYTHRIFTNQLCQYRAHENSRAKNTEDRIQHAE